MVYDKSEVNPPKSKKVIIAELQEQVAKLTKELESSKNSYKYLSEDKNKLSSEVEEMHCLFDTLVGCAGRKSTHEDSWARTDFSLATRFSSWLAFKLSK